MTKDDGHIIVDVRRQDEYDEGHIPGAVLIPNESITDKQPEHWIPTSTNSAVSIHGTARLKSRRKNIKRQPCSHQSRTAVFYARFALCAICWKKSGMYPKKPFAPCRAFVAACGAVSKSALHKTKKAPSNGQHSQKYIALLSNLGFLTIVVSLITSFIFFSYPFSINDFGILYFS